MPQNPTRSRTGNSANAINVLLATLLIVPMLLIVQGCSRKAETPAPVLTADDRALPIPVSDEPTSPSVKAKTPAAQRKIPVEDTLEPIPIDDASVPSSARGPAGVSTKK